MYRLTSCWQLVYINLFLIYVLIKYLYFSGAHCDIFLFCRNNNVQCFLWLYCGPLPQPSDVWLQHLYNLVHVDLSYNCLHVLEAAHTRLGNIKTLSLAGNQLDSLTGLSKLYSLVNLDLSHNQLAQVNTPRTFLCSN